MHAHCWVPRKLELLAPNHLFLRNLTRDSPPPRVPLHSKTPPAHDILNLLIVSMRQLALLSLARLSNFLDGEHLELVFGNMDEKDARGNTQTDTQTLAYMDWTYKKALRYCTCAAIKD